MSAALEYVGGYCVAGQEPVRVYREMIAVDTFGEILAQRRAEREAYDREQAAKRAAEIGPPTRAKRIAVLQQEVAIYAQSIRSRDINQTWGRLSADDYCSQTHSDMVRLDDLRAMLADAKGGAL